MPYVSRRQQGWAHTPAGTKALGGPAKVAEWDAASKGQKFARGGSVMPLLPSQASPVAARAQPVRRPVMPPQASPVATFAKGSAPGVASYAAGGPVLGRARSFLKEPDEFTGGRLPPKQSAPVKQDYAGGKPKGADKSEKTVLPRK